MRDENYDEDDPNGGLNPLFEEFQVSVSQSNRLEALFLFLACLSTFPSLTLSIVCCFERKYLLLSFMNFLRRPIQFEKINQFAYLQDTTSKL